MGQLRMFGARSGVDKVEPIATGDVIVTHGGVRCVVTGVDSDIRGAVYMCLRLDTGARCIVLEREVAYRSL